MGGNCVAFYACGRHCSITGASPLCVTIMHNRPCGAHTLWASPIMLYGTIYAAQLHILQGCALHNTGQRPVLCAYNITARRAVMCNNMWAEPTLLLQAE